jgi:hypothetical protein
MTGCDVIKGYYSLLADLHIRDHSPIQRLQRAYELRTGNSFYDTLKKSGKHDKTIHRGLLCYILRYEYRYTWFSIRDLCGYNCLQPCMRAISVFQSELTINHNLRRDYKAIKDMLSIN